jgi:hypothetical protein
MSATHFLAYAESVDSTVSNLMTILICLGIVLVVAVVAMVPVLVARSRGHRKSDTLVAMAVLWGVLTAVSATSTALAQMKYSHEQLLLIQSGYFDPADVTGAPKLPWVMWACLGGGYGILLVWAIAGRAALREEKREQ